MKKILLIAIFIYVAQSSFAQIQTQIKPPDQENTPVEKVPTEEEPNFILVEMMPHWQGCENANDETERTSCTFNKIQEYLANQIIYPASAKNKNITGTVYVTFVIDKNGMVKDVRILRGLSPDLDEEALRVVSLMSQWNPGIQRGKNVQVQYNLPVTFKLGRR